MKKPLLILALALSIFEFAPSGFCAPKAKPVEPTSKAKKVKKPKNPLLKAFRQKEKAR